MPTFIDSTSFCLLSDTNLNAFCSNSISVALADS